jgi:hypothetical protein
MTTETIPSAAVLPSKSKLAATTLAAALIATAILITIVLPAEYGIDPLGTGDALGLTVMSKAAVAEPVAAPAGATGVTPVVEGPVARYSAPFKRDAAEFTLGPYDYLEYKYHLAAGASMIYSWTATAPVIHDFHGEHDGDAENVTSYDKNNRRDDHGAFTAPFSGIHGWYWENPGGEPITVKVTSSGFYASALEFRSDKTRVPHELSVP